MCTNQKKDTREGTVTIILSIYKFKTRKEKEKEKDYPNFVVFGIV